jgi:hypothetical protein
MIKPFVRNRRSWGKPFWFSQKPRSTCTDASHPYKLDVVGARSAQCSSGAQAFVKLARTKAVRADHRLRTNDQAIRAQSTILG